MRRTPLVLGILSMSLGGLTVLTSLGGLVGRKALQQATLGMGELMGRLPQAPGQPSPTELMKRSIEAQESVAGYQLGLSLPLAVLSAILVVIGLGLVRRRPWARTAGIAWALAALAFLPVMSWLQYVVQLAVFQASVAPMSGAPSGAEITRIARTVQLTAAIVGTFAFYAPFPAVLLGLLVRRSAKADFEAPPPSP